MSESDILHFRYQNPVGRRLDHYLADTRGDFSRARWQNLIREGHVRVNGKQVKPNQSLRLGDEIVCTVPTPVVLDAQPEDIPLDILYEDADLLVLNKPAGLVVHPAPGHDSGTLVNALLHHCRDLAGIGGTLRPGIVHRLDRDTSGCLVVAKNDFASASLTDQFRSREVKKTYLALVWGAPRPAVGTIHTRIGRHPLHRKKMTSLPLHGNIVRARADDDDEDDEERTPFGREAITHFRTEKVYGPVSLLRVNIETGRTHQIRVHLAHHRHPVVGDTTYGRARAAVLPAPVTRQLLHAAELTFTHPRTGERTTLTAPLAADFKTLLDALSATEHKA